MGPDPDAVQDLLAQDAQLRALARRLVTDPDVAEDLTQDAWLVAATRKARGAPPPFGWLAHVVRNLSLHVGRGEGRRARRERAAARDEALPPTDEAVQRVEMRRRLIEAVLALEEPFRSTVILRYFENEPPRRIAARLGVPVETVRSRLKRALVLLRARLDRDFGGARGSWLVHIASLAGIRIPAATTSAAVASSSAGVGALALGAIVMKTKAIVACVIVALLVSAWFIVMRTLGDWSRPSGPTMPADAAGPAEPVSISHSEPAQPASARGEAESARAIVPKTVPDEERLASPPGTVEVQVVWQLDRAPASGLRVRLIAARQMQSRENWRFALTDAGGWCRFEGIACGQVALFASPNGYVLGTECKAGDVVRATIEVPEGRPVKGRVLDARREPVNGAEIWLSDDVTVWDGAVVARSGPDGTFTIRGVRSAEERPIGARATGHTASPLHLIPWGVLDLEPFELILGDEPATVAGSVLGADGVAVAGATVMIGAPGWDGPRRGRSTAPGVPTFRVSTDAGGRYQFSGLPPGDWALIARTRFSPVTRAMVSLDRGQTREIAVRFARGATVVGEVVDDSGAPVPRIVVQCEPKGSWLSPSAMTDPEGRFRLEGVEAGQVSLAALGGDRGNATATVEVGPGETGHVRIVMPAFGGDSIRGQVVDEAGAPIPSCTIGVEGWVGGASDFLAASTGKDGKFIVAPCRASEYVVRVGEPGARLESLRVEHVRPGPETLVVRIPDVSRVRSFVAGFVVDADGEPLRGVVVCLQGNRGGPNTPTGHDGSFRAGAVPAGSYRVRVQAPPNDLNLPICWIHESEDVVVGVGEALDLGTIRILNRLHARLSRRDGKSLDGVDATVWLGGVSGRSGLRLRIRDSVATSDPLPAGTHKLEIKGEGIHPVERKFELKLGEETRLDITLEAAKDR